MNAPAGPPPFGAPVESSVPLSRGYLLSSENLAVTAPDGKAVLAQMWPSIFWPDGSIRWLAMVFEAAAGPGDYRLLEGRGPSAPDLVVEQGDRVILNTGEIALSVSKSGGGGMISAAGKDGQLLPIIKGQAGDLILTRHDGKVFRASLAGNSRRVQVEERGPVRAIVREEGECRAEDGQKLLNYIIRWTAYRDRPEMIASITWINATDSTSEQLRDIRWTCPFEFTPDRMVIGCETGVYDGPFLKDWPVHILQEDHNCYWAKKRNPDGRVQHLSSGGCNGEHSPGWLYVASLDRCLGVWVPNFWQEYPNEIALQEGKLSVGLWPERAIDHLLSKPLLPAKPEGQDRYTMTKYWPVMPHPYVAFVDPAKHCLDLPQGVGKTQEVVLSVWAGRGESATFEKKWWSRSLKPVRGHLDSRYVAGTESLGPLSPREANSAGFEPLFDESFRWLSRHIDQLKCYGKFDYGDFHYFTAATDYMCLPGEKWGDMGEMPREGYWHNNERDPLLGLLLYYYRTGDPVAWERCQILARHLLDIDMRHHPNWGVWTHTYGHCYLALGEAGEPDHSWLWGLLVWAGVSGDPLAWDWTVRCGERLRDLKIDFIQTDARTVAVYLHMMCQFYSYTGDAKYLDAARAPVAAFLRLQSPDGSWPAYMGNLQRPRDAGFVEHAVVALADFYVLTRDTRTVKAVEKALHYLFGERDNFKVDVGETPLALYALAIMARETGHARYLEVARMCLQRLRQEQNQSNDPYGRGDLWAKWGVNNPDRSKGTSRSSQFLGQTRPLSPACLLAYGQPCLGVVAGVANQP